MKLRITLLSVLLVAGSLLSAQQFNGGLILGISTSEISGDLVNGPSKVGIYSGVFVNRKFWKKSFFQLELNFVQKGSKKNPDTINFNTYILRLNYAEVHILYKNNFRKKLSFEIGPSFGYLLHQYEAADEMQLNVPFEKWDIGLDIGLIYAFTEKWKLDIRYFNTIFFPVRKHASGATYFLNRGQYNEVLSFTMHYQFRTRSE